MNLCSVSLRNRAGSMCVVSGSAYMCDAKASQKPSVCAEVNINEK